MGMNFRGGFILMSNSDIDRLPSWNDGPVKDSIIDFIRRTTIPGVDYVEPADRIATFDNDGTLWVEKPVSVQINFMAREFARQAKLDPSLLEKQPYKAFIERDVHFFKGVGEQNPDIVMTIIQAIVDAWAGITPEEFEIEVMDFITTVKHEKFQLNYTDLVYKPMLELFDFLNSYDYRVFVCSGGDREFMRVFAEKTWNIYKEDVIGTHSGYEYVDGKLKRSNKVSGGLALGPGKVEQIFARTGRLPIFAAGNGDVDIEMLDSAKFKLLIHHDDALREYAYVRGAERILADANDKNYTVVSMKNHWNTMF